MNTTALFVEFIIIGSGAITWLALLCLSLFGYAWVHWDKVTSIVALIPFLALVYSLGIVIDRLSDLIFSKWDKKIRLNTFPNNAEYHTARTYVYTYATDKILNLFEYGRSRIRISRAWFINHLMLMVSIPIFVWTQLSKSPTSLQINITIFSIIIFGLSSIATLITWEKLIINDYKRLIETYEFLKIERSNKTIE
jgi:hypothetical protein